MTNVTMESTRQSSALDRVPDWWFEPVAGLAVVLLAIAGIRLTTAVGSTLLNPLGVAPWAAVIVATTVAVTAYGGFGIGLTYVYRTYRNFGSEGTFQSLGRPEWRWLTGLTAVALVGMGVGGLWSNGIVASIPQLGVGSVVYPEGIAGLSLGLAGVNDMVNQAPLVVFGALLGGVLMGPAMGALFHGVFQDTLAQVSPRLVALAGTAAVSTAAAGTGSSVSVATVVVFAFVLGVAYAYRRTENLVMAMAAYGLFNVLALVLAWVDVLASLHAHGHLLG